MNPEPIFLESPINMGKNNTEIFGLGQIHSKLIQIPWDLARPSFKAYFGMWGSPTPYFITSLEIQVLEHSSLGIIQNSLRTAFSHSLNPFLLPGWGLPTNPELLFPLQD